MERKGKGLARLRGLAIPGTALAAFLAWPVLAQEKPGKAPAVPPLDFGFVSSAAVTEAHRKDGETSLVLLGEAHLVVEIHGKTARPGPGGEDLSEKQLLDVRAENAVVYVPDALVRVETRPRALYAEGHVRFEQRFVHARGAHAGLPPVLVEADRIFVDLVAERIYAVSARARLPAGPKRLPSAGSSADYRGPAQQAAFTIRAETLRVRGAEAIDCEDASLSVCDFGLPHEAIEAEKLRVNALPQGKPPPGLTAAAAIGDLGGTAVAHEVTRDLPFRALRDILREGKSAVPEGSDAMFHAVRDERRIEAEGLWARLRPPFLGEEGVAAPFPFPIDWDTSWLFPTVRVGHSSRFGYFGLAELKVPILREEIAHVGSDGYGHVKRGLGLDAIVGAEEYEKRGPAGELGAAWDWSNEEGVRKARGMARAFFVHDRADLDRDGVPIPEDDRYWLHGLHQQDLPAGVHVDAEVSKQSDRDFLLEYFRNVALREKEQETYIYLRRTFEDLRFGSSNLDDLGARLTGKWRLNDFQSQTEELPRFRVDWISTPLLVREWLGGLYLTSGVEGARFRVRPDDATELGDTSVSRGDFDGRLDWKRSILDLAYLRAYGEGRYTAWSDDAADSGGIHRFLGAAGARIGSQADAVFPLSERLALRHVVIPEVGYEDRLLVTKQPEELIQVDEVETYRRGQFVFGRLRNRLQYAKDSKGMGSDDLLDVTIEGRYFPTRERLQPDRAIWGTLLGDGRLYFPWKTGVWRTEVEMDPTRNRVIRFESTIACSVTRIWLEATRPVGEKEKRSPYPDLAISASYSEVSDIVRAVGFGATLRATPSWAFRVEELYDIDGRRFLRHRASVTRFFHGFALEVAGTYDPILRDTSFSFSFSPRLDAEDRDSFRDGRYAGLSY